tara:strand:+ start:1458 stop:1679 length:222 start_codon:yes stop_codon:yes gene_type:complete
MRHVVKLFALTRNSINEAKFDFAHFFVNYFLLQQKLPGASAETSSYMMLRSQPNQPPVMDDAIGYETINVTTT